MHDEHKKETVKSEVRLKAKTQVDNTYDVAFGLKFKSTSAEPADGKNGSEKNQVKLDAASIGRAFGPVYVISLVPLIIVPFYLVQIRYNLVC